MANPFLGEIRPFGFNFAPRGWATCNGQLLPISQNTALFSLLGTFYGGDGKVTFALPDLQGRGAIGRGQGPGLSDRILGEIGGTSSVTLLLSELPAHTHTPQVSSSLGDERHPFAVSPPVGHRWAGSAHTQYAAALPDTQMNPNLIGVAGGSQPHNNESPYQTILYCIATQGIFPARN